MSLYTIKPKFRHALIPLADRLSWVHPDVITACSVASAAAAWLCIRQAATNRGLFLAVPLCLFIRIACNALDGLVAERTKKARAFGEVLNEGADRVADVLILFGLGFTPWASLVWAGSATIAVLFSSYAGLLGKAVGVGRQYGGVLGKADRMLLLGVASLLLWLGKLTHPFSLGMFYFQSGLDLMLAGFVPLAFLTAGWRIRWIYQQLRSTEVCCG